MRRTNTAASFAGRRVVEAPSDARKGRGRRGSGRRGWRVTRRRAVGDQPVSDLDAAGLVVYRHQVALAALASSKAARGRKRVA